MRDPSSPSSVASSAGTPEQTQAPTAWRYRLTLPGEKPGPWVYTDSKSMLPRRPEIEWELQALFAAPVPPSASSDEDTGTTVAEPAMSANEDYAIEYAISLFKGYGEHRNPEYAAALRGLQQRIARASCVKVTPTGGTTNEAVADLTPESSPAVDAGTTDARSCTHCDGDGYVPARHPTEDGERFDDCPVCRGSGERVTDDEILKLRARAGDVEPLEYELAELRASLESRSPAVDDETGKPDPIDASRVLAAFRRDRATKGDMCAMLDALDEYESRRAAARSLRRAPESTPEQSMLAAPGIYGATAKLIDEAERVALAQADEDSPLPHLVRAIETARRELAALRFRPVRPATTPPASETRPEDRQ